MVAPRCLGLGGRLVRRQALEGGAAEVDAATVRIAAWPTGVRAALDAEARVVTRSWIGPFPEGLQ